MKRTIISLIGCLACAQAVSGAKSTSDADVPGMINDLTACRQIVETTARLGCYDTRIDKLSAANEQGGLVVLSRQQVHQARRSLFGFTLPKLSFLEDNREKTARKTEEPDNEIDSKIQSARNVGLHEWRIVLEDGAIWETSEAPALDPDAGDPIHIKRAALGSYLANIHGQRAVRIRRVG